MSDEHLPAPQSQCQPRAADYGCVSQVDDSIGQILQALRETGQLDNTIVVDTADHGDFAAYHGLAKKNPRMHNVYKEILRVPSSIDTRMFPCYKIA